MFLTPLQTAVAAALVLAYIMVDRINAAGPRAIRLRRRHAVAARAITSGRRDFEREHHLVSTPPVGTPVVLIANSPYLRDYHGAVAGQTGTVVRHSLLNIDDDGVLVNWGVRPNYMVRMNLDELRLPERNDGPQPFGH
ncbi:hypothetical protein WMO79_01205 [Micrococcaceae bacterium Sec7.4]